MRLASGDEELRAALFRLVDVTPACRSVEDIGAHLASFTAEHRRLAARVAGARAQPTRAWAASCSAAPSPPACATPPGASSPARGRARPRGELERLWEAGIASSLDLLGEATVSPAEADAYAARCASTLSELAQLARGMAAAGAARARRRRRASAREPVGQGVLADGAAARGGAGARRRRRGAAPAPVARVAPASSAPTSTSTWSHSTRWRRPSSWRSGCSRSRASARALVPGSSCRPICASPRRSSSASSSWAAATPRRAPLTVRLVKGAYWDHEVAEAAPARLGRARLHRQGRVRPQLRGADAAAARRAAAGARGDRLPQPALDRPRDRLEPAAGRARRRTSSCRCCAASATTSRAALARQRRARARLRAGRRPRGRHGLPGAAPAREHLERVVPARRRSRASRSSGCWPPREPPPLSPTSRRSSCAAPPIATRSPPRSPTSTHGCRWRCPS